MRILCVTGIRSEYDILYPVLTELKKANHELFIVASGAHLSDQHNNTYKRIKLINSIFPNAAVLMPYRDPLQHAYSLLKQHKHFYEIQKADKFILEYMNFLGHNEFGLNYKSWNLPEKYNDPFTLNHWLEQWYLFYQNIIMDIAKNKNVTLISYDKLCNNSELTNNLVLKLNLNKNEYNNYFKLSRQNIKEDYDESLLMKCNQSQEKLNRMGL